MTSWRRTNRALTPLFQMRTPPGLANFSTSKRMSSNNSSVMQPKISKGQDESKVTTELQALLENGWKLNDEQIQLEKTYHFKTYTKVLVIKEIPIQNCHKHLADVFFFF
jgi:4a-hydroxytetrahydrobiopterin dehydratase